MDDVNDVQIDGTHYKRGGKIQHWDFVDENDLDYLTGCATKYIARNRFKHETPLLDLQKAQHYTEKLHAQAVKGKKPRGKIVPLVISVDDFAKANKLTEVETELVRELVEWETKNDLIGIVLKIQELIDAAAFIHDRRQ